ncbi:hypothetical protein A2U01_0089252, partial [Trifolium medium]|nr:hypothetical protein [Trifolium medium]
MSKGSAVVSRVPLKEGDRNVLMGGRRSFSVVERVLMGYG